MHRSYARSRQSLRAIESALGLPVRQMSHDEIDASLVKFGWLAQVRGMSREDAAAAIQAVRAQARDSDAAGCLQEARRSSP